MLRTPTTFPQVGSYALYVHEGQTTLARIQHRDGDEVLISMPLVQGASGNRTVPFDQLIDGTPLTEAERGEAVTLSSKVGHHHKAPRGRQALADWQRYNALRSRGIYAGHLGSLIQAAEARSRRAA